MMTLHLPHMEIASTSIFGPGCGGQRQGVPRLPLDYAMPMCSPDVVWKPLLSKPLNNAVLYWSLALKVIAQRVDW